jgi:hypothetical protein
MTIILGLLALLELPARIALFVLIIIWGWQGHRAVSGLAMNRKWGRGWTIGAWFIPFASIVLPKLVFDETERIAKAATSGMPAANWRTTSTSTAGKIWWWGFILSNFVAIRTSFTNAEVQLDPDPSDYRTYYLSLAIGSFIAMVSAFCGIAYVQEVAARVGPKSPMFAPRPVGAPPSAASNRRELVAEVVAERTAHAATFCDLCREPMSASAVRCPRCGKPRKKKGKGEVDEPPSAPAAPSPTPPDAPGPLPGNW